MREQDNREREREGMLGVEKDMSEDHYRMRENEVKCCY